MIEWLLKHPGIELFKYVDYFICYDFDGLLYAYLFFCFFFLAKLVPLAYGIHKLQISCVVEDDKVSVDLLTETIEEIQDYVRGFCFIIFYFPK